MFEELAAQAINSDQQYRQEILQRVKQSQETAELVLILTAFGTISLSLLLFAYLNSDLFTPLQVAGLFHYEENKRKAKLMNIKYKS